MESTEQNTQTEQNQQTHQNHQPDLGRQTSHTNQSDRKDQQASHPQAGNAPWPPLQRQDGSTAAEHCHAPESLCRRDFCANRESNMDPHNGMDLTAYLQTEGRRRAAELAGGRHSGDLGLPAPSSQAQRQCAAAVDDPQPPQCLSEALRRMGVT